MKWLVEYFNLSKGERNGITVVVILLLLLIASQFLLKYFVTPEKISFSDFQKEINIFQRSLAEKDSQNTKEKADYFSAEREELRSARKVSRRFPFDPNTASFDDLKKLGLKGRVARTLINFRKKGGRFYRKEDLKKVYGLNEKNYRKLAPYVVIKREERQSSGSGAGLNKRPESLNKEQKERNRNVVIELNSADSLDLVKVSGIGPIYSARILKYRDLLGGFYSKGQLLEVYGIDSVEFDHIAPQVKIDTTLIIRKSLNKEGFKEMIKHPYLDYATVLAIINYRKRNGGFKSVKELSQKKIVGIKDFEHLRNYFKL